jgi:hypothetical protein
VVRGRGVILEAESDASSGNDPVRRSELPPKTAQLWRWRHTCFIVGPWHVGWKIRQTEAAGDEAQIVLGEWSAVLRARAVGHRPRLDWHRMQGMVKWRSG